MTSEAKGPPKPTGRKQDGTFPPGVSGNPSGRPKGARGKLAEAFIQDMLADWESNGPQAIIAVREEKPDAYLKVVASILPKEMNLRVGEFDDLTDDQLARQLANIASQLARAGVDIGEGIATPQASQSLN